MSFIEAVFVSDIPIVRYALIAALLASIPFGVVGTFVVAKRISYIAGSIAHCSLGGIGASLYFQQVYHIEWFTPVFAATLAAFLAALTIGIIRLYAHERQDTVISALWAIGMAIGLLFIAKTPGYFDPMSYLFGNILMITEKDLWLIGCLDLFIVGTVAFFYHRLQAVCFDEEFAKLRGIRVEIYYMFLLCLIALSVVLLLTVVGILLVVALLTLPAATAGHLTRRLWQMMLLAVVFSLLFSTGGLTISYYYDLPGSPVMILVAALSYISVLILRKFGALHKKKG